MQTISEIRRHLASVPGAMEYGEGVLDKLVGEAPGISIAQMVWGNKERHFDDGEEQPIPARYLDEPEKDSDEILQKPIELSDQLIFETPPDIELDKARSILGGEKGIGVHNKVRQRGIEALAYYIPFHQTFVQWGIYLPESSIHHLAFEVFGGLKTTAEVKLRLAFQALHAHELFHFAAEYMAAQIEFFANEALFLRKIRDDKSRPLRYDALEERSANAHMLRVLRYGSKGRRVNGAYKAMCAFVETMPEGYRDGRSFVSAQRFAETSRKLAEEYHTRLQSRYFAHGADLLKLFPFEPGIDWRYCPIHTVPDSNESGLPPLGIRFIQRVDPVFEVPGFLKSLQRLPQNISNAWSTTKNKLATSAQLPGLDFKKWPPLGSDWYSVRVTASVRAHLRFDKSGHLWHAEKIGGHKELGHG